MLRDVVIPADAVRLPGLLAAPEGDAGVVVFAHGSGSSRHSPRNQYVAEQLQQRGLGTLLFDLLTPEEDRSREARFDIELLASRLVSAIEWVTAGPEAELQGRPLGLFGASTGAAAALIAAAKLDSAVRAVVSRGGRPDMALDYAPRVRADTLLIVGELDRDVLELNREAYAALRCEKELAIVPGATHLFEEPGTLEEAARLASDWFDPRLRMPEA